MCKWTVTTLLLCVGISAAEPPPKKKSAPQNAPATTTSVLPAKPVVPLAPAKDNALAQLAKNPFVNWGQPGPKVIIITGGLTESEATSNPTPKKYGKKIVPAEPELPSPDWSAPVIRVNQLTNQSEDFRNMSNFWKRFWKNDQPSHMTPERVHGGIL